MTESESTTKLKSEEILNNLKGVNSVFQNILPESVGYANTILSEVDFPTSRHEDWKYTRTTKLSNELWKNIPFEGGIDITEHIIEGLDTHTIVFSNGHFNTELSSQEKPEGWQYNTLAQIDTEMKKVLESIEVKFDQESREFLPAFNRAYCNDGIVIRINKNSKINKTIHLIFIQQGELVLSNTQVSILSEQGSEANIVCTYISADGKKAWGNHFLKAYVQANASLNIYKIQHETDNNFLTAQDDIYQEKDSRFNIVTMTIEGGWIRNNLNIIMGGHNSESHLSGFSLPRGKDLVDNHTFVDHRVANCNSTELYKNILNDSSTGVFNGKVYVREDAQKTNAYQNNANILMNENAQMNTKPELEIYADDVKCSHGTTTGQIDANALFYLKSRGLGEESAIRLLTSAFINDVINKVNLEPLKKHVTDQLIKKNLLIE